MAAKRIDPLKAKEAKQKKIAAAGAVLLLALLGFQGPKTLKMLQGPQPVASPVSAATATPTGTTPAPTPTAGAPTPAATGAELANVADSDAAPTVEQGQLATFERFASKDPFVQQAQPEPTPAPRPQQPNDGAQPNSAKTDQAPAAEDGDGTSGGFTSGDSAPAAPELASATSIAVNGVAEDVTLEAAFPKNEPTFVLVSVARNGKSVEIGIAGGEYAAGGETMTLGLGKKLTLQNTADGSRYELELLAIQGQPLPKKKK